MTYKLYCIFSKEAVDAMKGNRGKLAAQAGHAYLHAWWDSNNRFLVDARTYQDSKHAFKICLVVPTKEELYKLHNAYFFKCGVSLVKDAGLTVFEGPTITCLGIGPIHENDVGDDLKSLKVLI